MLTDGAQAALPEAVHRPLAAFAAEYLAEDVPFGGRAEALAALDAWLADPARPCALVVASAGRGKSALLARWARSAAARVPAVFAPVSIRFGTALRAPAMLLLAAQLRRIAASKGELPRDPDAARAEIEAILAAPDGGPRLVVIDGLDEAVGWSVPGDLRLPAAPPPGTKLLVSAREVAGCDLLGWRRRLGWSEERTLALALPPLDERHVAEVLRTVGASLAPGGDRDQLARVLARLTEGDPLVLRLYLDALRTDGGAAALLGPAELASAVPGLDGYLARWWSELRASWRGAAPRLERDVRELLGALATALGPLGREDLAALVPVSDREAREAALRALGRLVIGDGEHQGFVLSHPRLAYHHAERLSADERAAWERRFVEYGEAARAALEGGGTASAYVVRHHGAHLERAGADFRALSQLVAPAWQRAWEALEGAFDGFLGDVERAAASAEAALATAPPHDEAAAAATDDTAAAATAALFRCALVRASISSLVHRVPAPLFAGLLEAELWFPAVALAYAGLRGDPAIDAIADLLPDALVPAALAHLDGDGPRGFLPRAAARLLRRRIALGAAHEVLPFVARRAPEYRARVLLALAPHLSAYAELRDAALAEIRAAAEQLGDYPINERTTILMMLAAQLPPMQRPQVLARAVELAHEDTDLEAKHLTLLGRAGALEEALRRAERESYPYTRSLYFAHALAGVTSLFDAVHAFDAWERAERAVWPHDDTVLRSAWPLPLPAPLVERFRRLALALPFERARALALVQLARIHGAGIADAAAAVRALDGPERTFGLLALAPALDVPDRAAALAEVLAAVRAHPRGAPDAAWDWADRHWQLPTDGEIHWQQGAVRTLAELLATAARLSPPTARVPLLREALAAARELRDGASTSLALTALAARLGGDARAEIEAAALALARAADEPGPRATALAALAPSSAAVAREALAASARQSDPYEATRIALAVAGALPADERYDALESILDAHLRYRRERDGGEFGQIAPHLPAELLERARALARSDIEILRIAVQGAWPTARRQAVEAGARGALEACLRDPFLEPESWLRDVAPHLPGPLLREAVSIAVSPTDKPFAPEPHRVLRWLLPCLAQRGAGAEAIEHARAIDWAPARVPLLASLLPHLTPPLLDDVSAEVLAWVRALPAGPRADEDYTRLSDTLAAACALAPLGHARDVAAAADRALGPSGALHILASLAGGLAPAERRELLTGAIDRALALPDDQLSLALSWLLPHAALLERRPLAALLARALAADARYGRARFLTEDGARRAHERALALEALGGPAALIGAARACIEVSRWFP